MNPPVSLAPLIIAQEVLIQQFSDDPKTVERLQQYGKALEPTFNAISVNYCLDRYIEAELDFQSKGNRGLGRVTEAIPRLGAFFCKKLSAMPADDLKVLRALINNQCLLGYLTHVFFSENEVLDMKSLNEEKLYESWIPSIYSNSLSDISEDMDRLFTICSQRGAHGLKAFFHGHDMKTGWLQSDDVPDAIVKYYFIAGWCLREIETSLVSKVLSSISSEPSEIISWDEFKGRENSEKILIAKGEALADAIYSLSFQEMGAMIDAVKRGMKLTEVVDEFKPAWELIVFLRTYAMLLIELTNLSDDKKTLLVKTMAMKIAKRSCRTLNRIDQMDVEKGMDRKSAKTWMAAGIMNQQERRGKIYCDS